MGGGAILEAATWILPLVLAIVLHEISHGWVAAAFGDPTARRKGRLSLNPLRHVDPVGTVGLPLLLALAGAPIFGWAKPVPVVARRMRHPRRDMILVALAGPGMNLLLAILAAFLLALIGEPAEGQGLAALFLRLNLLNFVAINVFLAVFNMLPLPPFDGGHVVEGLLPRRLAVHYAKLHRVALPLFMLLLLVLPALSPRVDIVDRLVRPPVDWLTGALLGG
ncbi:MAG TPA: site-2 protease family protein [Allosphingosinicella sp.]|nr:site-2 protease family protein [Allosphingosinicella sp.]